MDQTKKFYLFPNCKVVKGASISIICDFQREKYFYISDGLVEILESHSQKTIAEIKSHFYNEYDSIIEGYFDFLLKNDFGVLVSSISDLCTYNFKEIDILFEHPTIINNAILDIAADSKHNYEKFFFELELLKCKHLEIRSFDVLTINELIQILEFTRNKKLRYINLILKYTEEMHNEWPDLLSKYPVIAYITFHSAPMNDFGDINISKNCDFITQVIADQYCCGKISMKGFTVNLKLYLESLSFNNCLYKKISVDKDGFIKNCPSHKNHFGKLGEINMMDVVFKEEFMKLGKVNKDQISVCKDCQFRYICTDCRAYLQNDYDKPKYCNYDPYKNVWN